MDQDSRTALVTGAANGIGRGTAERLRDAGWQVFALDVDTAGLERLDPAIEAIPADVSDEPSVMRAVARVREMTPGLGLLVNNAGIANPVSGPIEDLALQDWNAWIGTNLTGAMLMVKHCAPLLRAAKGSVVNVTSTRALMSEPFCEGYAAAKGGLTALTHALAVSLGPEVRVNAVAPGWIATGGEDELRDVDHAQHPVGRVGRPEDVAEAILYLAGAGFVTGETLVVDGGMTRKMIYAE